MAGEASHTTWRRGEAVGQYYLLERIARGGMAEIYRGIAEDLHGIRRNVVIKKILPQVAANREFIDMLIAEAKIAVLLSHGNIAQIYDLGKAGDDYFIVMEHVDGPSLSQIQRECAARRRYIPVPIACYIGAEIAAGLDYMHQRTDEQGQPLHIVHRDVSPQNVMVSYGGTVKLIDFGIAKARTKLETTEVGILKGKFAYMSPEHARGNPIDWRSDIFSLGVILHEMLTGKRLFKAKDHRETLHNVRTQEASPPSSVRGEVPASLDAIVLQALVKDPQARFHRAITVHDALVKVLHQCAPQFREQQLSEFLAELCVRPTGEPSHEEKTPLLIMDRTHSAIAVPRQDDRVAIETMIPSVMAEFMLPEPIAPQEAQATVEEAALPVPDGEEDEGSVTSAQWLDWWWRLRHAMAARSGRWWGRWGSACVLGGVLLGGAVLWWHGTWSPLAVWQVMRPPWIVRHIPPSAIDDPHVMTLRIESAPSGAAIYLDDRNTGLTTPAMLDRLPVGAHYRLGLHLPQYRYIEQTLSISPTMPEVVRQPLALDYGRLHIITTPAGADVELNGHSAGKTPLVQEEMEPGAVVDVRLTMEGYHPVEKIERVRPGQTLDIREVLVRKRP
ncbi:MAG: serine/threonine protein kinase [Deltaproteobacteria bacterium]|nr:serine/threonine protein kinase [Deltaproteobacteria bacterium]